MIDVQQMSDGFATGADIETGAGCERVAYGAESRADGQEAARAQTPAAGGRPLVLDATKRAEVCAMLAAGCSFRTAARYVGVTAGAVSQLLKRDETFRVQVDKALANREFIPLSQIRAAGGKSWRAAAWLLERTVKGTYRQDNTADPVDISDAVDKELREELKTHIVSEEARSCVRERLAELARGGEED